MQHELQVMISPDLVAQVGARYVAEHARTAVADHGKFTFAISGGYIPWAMFADERCARPVTRHAT